MTISLANQLRNSVDQALEDVLLRGATPWELDEALEERGFAQGLLKTQDEEGLDTALARRKAGGLPPLLVMDRMAHEGRLGRKVGVGWYRYPGGKGAVVDPLVDDLIAEEAYFAKLSRGEFDPDIAAQQVILAMDDACLALIKQVHLSAHDQSVLKATFGPRR